jgi:hypothetical protein
MEVSILIHCRHQVYSSWYLRYSVAIELAFSGKWIANSLEILSVLRRVPYRSNAITILEGDDILRGGERCMSRKVGESVEGDIWWSGKSMTRAGKRGQWG